MFAFEKKLKNDTSNPDIAQLYFSHSAATEECCALVFAFVPQLGVVLAPAVSCAPC